MLQNFFSLTPDEVLRATETLCGRTTGLCYTLGSLENRVYELEQEDGLRVVTKFYRPSRWSEEAIGDEHRLLLALRDHEVPVCAPRAFANGDTLGKTDSGIYFAVFFKAQGRSPDELSLDDFGQLGRLLGRIHNISASMSLKHRPLLDVMSYGDDALATIVGSGLLPASCQAAFVAASSRLLDTVRQAMQGAWAEALPLHGDCHRGNLLRGNNGFFFLDFDDMAHGPAVQDMWLLLPARAHDCPQHLAAIIEGYSAFRAFDRRQVRWIEPLRALRYLRYAAWVARRFDDPSFVRAYPDFTEAVYWQRLQNDLYEQLGVINAQMADPAW